MMKASRGIGGSWRSITILIVFAAMLAVCISPAMASALTCDICVNESGWWRDGGVFNANATTPIQAAVTNATAGETIYVWNGSYSENVDVSKRLTLAGEGADVVNVSAPTPGDDYVFNVAADYVNISGFTVTGATGDWNAGIYLNFASHCNISDNNCTNNEDGIYMESSSNNTLMSNNASNNQDYGIMLCGSSDNTLTSNTANSNSYGTRLYSSSNNTLSNNTAKSNRDTGIYMKSSSNNTLSNNTASKNQDYGIMLYGSSNDNTLTSNTANSNSYGTILYSSSNNTLSNNTANSNSDTGIYLYSSSNNTLSNNNANSNSDTGIYLYSSSNNTLSNNTASDNNNCDIRLGDSLSNTFTDNTLNGTTVSFAYGGDVSLKGVGLPAGAPGWYSIGKFINVVNQGEGAWIILNFSYSDSDFTGAMNESNLAVRKYSGTWFEDGWNGTRYLDLANNIVGVNITSFGVFAPMTTGVPALHHITVEPGSVLLNIDEPPKSQTFAVTGCSKHADPIPDLMFGWNNTDMSVGWLNKSTGTAVNFTAEHVGIAHITARNGNVTSDQVRVTVDGETNSTTVTNGTAIVTSGNVNVTCDFSESVTGLINITAIGNTIDSSEVNQSDPCYGLGSGDMIVSGVTVNVNDTILGELAAGNGTIHIRMGYTTTTLAALGIDASTLAIWKYNSTTETWVKQSSTISTISERCVCVDVDHLCIFALVGSTTTGGTDPLGSTDPTGGSGTLTPTVTAAKALTATATATVAPPGEPMLVAAKTTKPAAAETTVPAAGATPTKPKHWLPGFTAVFAGCGVLVAMWVVMWQRA